MVFKVEVDEDMLVYALRYALGRQSYAVNDVILALEEHWEEEICKNNADIILRDIKEYLNKTDTRLDCCYEDWKNCLKYLEEHYRYDR